MVLFFSFLLNEEPYIHGNSNSAINFDFCKIGFRVFKSDKIKDFYKGPFFWQKFLKFQREFLITQKKFFSRNKKLNWKYQVQNYELFHYEQKIMNVFCFFGSVELFGEAWNAYLKLSLHFKM